MNARTRAGAGVCPDGVKAGVPGTRGSSRDGVETGLAAAGTGRKFLAHTGSI
jgi:hypothetical protein